MSGSLRIIRACVQLEGWDSQISKTLTHGWSAFRGADRCDVMHCATTNGIGSRIFFLAAKATWEARRPTTDCSSKRFCIDFGPASRGGIFQSVSAIGRSSTSASAGGRRAEFLTAFSLCWRAITTTNT